MSPKIIPFPDPDKGNIEYKGFFIHQVLIEKEQGLLTLLREEVKLTSYFFFATLFSLVFLFCDWPLATGLKMIAYMSLACFVTACLHLFQTSSYKERLVECIRHRKNIEDVHPELRGFFFNRACRENETAYRSFFYRRLFLIAGIALIGIVSGCLLLF